MTKVKQKHEKLTPALLLAQIEALLTAPTVQQAAIDCNVTYPTFLNRFRRAGLRVRDIKQRVNYNKEMPEMIVSKAFKKPDKKLLDFKELTLMLRSVSEQLARAEKANAA